jgi:hypothetical protein
MILSQSKSVCEVRSSKQLSNECNGVAPGQSGMCDTVRRSPLYHSVSLLDSIPKLMLSKSPQSSELSLNNMSVSVPSSSCSSAPSTPTSSNYSLSVSSLSVTSCCSSSSFSFDHLSRQHTNPNPSNTSSPLLLAVSSTQRRKRRKKKLKKATDVTKELAMFTIRRDENTLYFDYLNVITSSGNNQSDEQEIDLWCDSVAQDFFSSLTDKFFNNQYTFSNVRLMLNSDLTTTERRRPHRHRLKALMRRGDMKAMCQRGLACQLMFEASGHARLKCNQPIAIKYNLYRQLNTDETFISKLERLRCTQSARKIDARHRLDAAFLVESKRLFKSIRLVDFLLNKKGANSDQQQQGADGDLRVVVDNSLTHNTTAAENDFDAQYLEFLIQLQHRDITPEDYEYLTRLDEQIAKKTLSENLLNSLETQQVDASLLAAINDEVCGICLDNYALGQLVKCLPCKHRFHAECIDNWLRNQSCNCPLDNLPIDRDTFNGVKTTANTAEIVICNDDDDDDGDYEWEINDQDTAIQLVMNEILDSIVTKHDVSLLLQDCLNKIT